MQFIPTKVHGVLDYLGGLLLIAAPWLLNFDGQGPETWIPVALGLAMIGGALFTNYELGLIPVIPMKMHLAMDALMGAFLAASPWLFQFDDIVWAPHLILGLLEVGGAAMTQTEAEHHIGHRTGGMKPTV